MAVLRIIGFLASAVLLLYGVWFQIQPDAALSATFHLDETLPAVMGGRYAFFGVILFAALLYKDNLVTSFLLFAFGCLAVFDTVLYLKTDPVPHLAVGLVSFFASAIYFRNRGSQS